MTYDAAGNMLTAGAYTYRHDGEGRLYWMYHTSDVYTQGKYVYNALGQRVQRYNGSVGQWDNIYNDPWGHEAVVTNTVSGVAQEIYLPPVAGRNYAMYYGGVTYFTHANALGSSGMLTDQTGTAKQEALYTPWGGKWAQAGYGGYPINLQYAGMRPVDPAAPEGSYFFTPNRAYMSNWGRWLTPDPENAGADTSDPQSWNAYAYVGNNPTSRTDPDGTNYIVCQAAGQNCADLTNPQYDQFRQQNPDLYATASGDLYLRNPSGSETKLGTESYYNEHALDSLVLAGREAAGPVNFLAKGLIGFLAVAIPESIAFAEAPVGLGLGGAAGIGRMGEEGSSATAPVGQRGSPMKVAPGTNADTEIGGIRYSGHALDGMQSEGIPPSAVKDAIQNGSHVPTYGDRVAHFGSGVKAVTARDGTVVTVMLQSR